MMRTANDYMFQDQYLEINSMLADVEMAMLNGGVYDDDDDDDDDHDHDGDATDGEGHDDVEVWEVPVSGGDRESDVPTRGRSRFPGGGGSSSDKSSSV